MTTDSEARAKTGPRLMVPTKRHGYLELIVFAEDVLIGELVVHGCRSPEVCRCGEDSFTLGKCLFRYQRSWHVQLAEWPSGFLAQAA